MERVFKSQKNKMGDLESQNWKTQNRTDPLLSHHNHHIQYHLIQCNAFICAYIYVYVYIISLCYFTPVDPWRVNEAGNTQE